MIKVNLHALKAAHVLVLFPTYLEEGLLSMYVTCSEMTDVMDVPGALPMTSEQ